MSFIEKSHKLLLIIGLLFSASTLAATSADDFAAAEQWPEAVSAYQEQLLKSPDDAGMWFQLAVSARQAEQFATAINALNKAEELQFAPLRISFERARLDVLANETAAAMEKLAAIEESGFTSVGFLSNDPVLGTLAGNADFDAMIARMELQAYPCEHDDAFKAFDFWIGEWDVHAAGGIFAGTNKITRQERGCVLFEDWQSAGGGGSSINYVDKTTGEWVQIWNSEGGAQINIRGGMTDEGMRLVGTIHYVANGTTAPFRGLWTPLPDGTVRQYFEQSSDGGETWAPWFEGFYSRKTD